MFDPKGNKTVNINIRVPEGIKRDLTRLAVADRRTLSDYIRLQLEKLTKCNVSAEVLYKGKRYTIPFPPQFELKRVQDIQAHLIPLVEYLKEQFGSDGSIIMCWNDDTEDVANKLTYRTSGNVFHSEVTQKINDFIKTKSWNSELRR
jgi:hypothetical protein